MKTQLTPTELQEHLVEQIQMLKNSAISFDNGSNPEYKRLATTVRVLLHDTKNSTSLLAQLNKKSIDFFDTAIPYNNEVFPHLGLINVTADASGSKSIPPLDSGMKALKRHVSFEKWWNGIVFSDKNGNEFSRKDIILFTSNQDGGAHIDPEVETEFLDLKKLDAQFGALIVINGISMKTSDGMPASIRQIAHELLKTLDPNYTCEKPNSHKGKFTLLSGIVDFVPGVAPKPNLTKIRPTLPNGKRISRKDICTCGSNKIYQDCCLLT